MGILNHLIVTGPSLAEAADHITRALGVVPGPGGEHPVMGTHNRLLSLGPSDYLEAMAPNPSAPPPGRARWYGADRRLAPGLRGWALKVTDLDKALELAPEGAGVPMEMRRGPYHWRMAVPVSGLTPWDGLFPALVEWQGNQPAPDLPDRDVRLVSLVLTHPKAGALGWAVSQLTEDDRVTIHPGPVGMRALFVVDGDERELT